MKVAAAYLRVSTERQDEYSLDSQLKLIRAYADKNDFIVPDEFVFVDDGISGRSAKRRSQFQTMIGWAKEKDRPFEAILVWKFSRFARNQEESIVYKSMLSRCGVSVVSVSEPLAEGPFGSLIERILEWMDEFYSIRLSAEVKRGMVEKVSRGEPVTAPSFGYDLIGREYVPNADAPTVRRVFADYLSGVGMVTIARSLAAEGVRTRRGNPPENRWVDYMLHNPVYVGKLRWSPEGKLASTRKYYDESFMLVDSKHAPLIDAETWQTVQAKLSAEHHSRLPYTRIGQPVEWMLKGLVRCSSCGSTLCRLSLACPSMQCHKYAHGQCAVSHSLSIAKANALVIAALENAAAVGIFPLAPHTVKPSAKAKDYDKLLNAERAKLARVTEAYEAGIDSLEEYARKKAKINSAISELESARSAEQNDSKPIDPEEMRRRIMHTLEIIKSDTIDETAKNSALRSVLSYIVYNKPAHRLELFFFS